MGWLEGGVGKNVTQRRGDAIDIGRAGKGQGGAAAKEAKADHRETKPDMHGSVLGGHGSAHTPGKESDEGRWFTAPAATDLTGENDELALGGLPQFKVCAFQKPLQMRPRQFVHPDRGSRGGGHALLR